MLPSGTLYVRPVSAKLLHDTELIGKMDPYVKILLGTEVQKTHTAKKHHLTPNWDDEFIFNLTGLEDFIVFEVFDKNLITRDDLIGVGSVQLSSIEKNTFNQWIPLVYKGADAGALLVEMNVTPIATSTASTTSAAQSSAITPPFESKMTPEFASGGLEPIVHTETIYTKLPAEYKQEVPLIHEKKIITEKPIITERTEIYSTQPILVEKHELQEKHFAQQAAPVVVHEQPKLVKLEPVLQKPELTEPGVVTHETEFRTEAPTINKETPQLFQKYVVTEQPIIHEKEILHKDIPIIHEKPEIRQQEFRFQEETLQRRDETKFSSQVSKELPDIPGNVHVQEERVYQKQPPIIQKERPEVYEKHIIQEKPIIHEQPLVFSEQQVVHEKPEVRETRVIHQEPSILQKETHTQEQERP